MNILVTGGAGFIGSHLVDALLNGKHNVVIIDNFDSFYSKEIKLQNIKEALLSSDVTLVEGDIRSKNILDNVFKTHNIQLVIHLAAKAGVRPSIENINDYYDVNINGTLNLLECMKMNNVKDMIFASSSSIYGDNKKVPFSESDIVDTPISPYAATKKSGELLCHVYSHLYNFNITCLRFFTVYGPRQRPDLAIHKFTKLIYDNKPIPFFGNGTTARDYTFVSDIVQGIMQAIKNMGGYRIYNLGESKTIMLVDLVNLLAKLIKKEVMINHLPNQEGDVEVTYADISKSISELGYNPRVAMEEGLVSFIKWFNTKNNKI
jgi:UDP-glucuronate 4-epimerase